MKSFMLVMSLLCVLCLPPLEAQTVRGLTNSGASMEMVITHNSNGSVSISSYSVSPQSGDERHLTLYDGAYPAVVTNDSMVVGFASSSSPYWFVPFNPNEAPTRFMTGGPPKWSCWCDGQYGICLVVQDGYKSSCSGATCDYCWAEITFGTGQKKTGEVSGVIVNGSSVTVNGVTFQ